jgi:hypothetical protein
MTNRNKTGFLYARMYKVRPTKDKNFLSKVIIGHETRICFRGLRFEVITDIKIELHVVLGSITRRDLQRCLTALGEVL